MWRKLHLVNCKSNSWHKVMESIDDLIAHFMSINSTSKMSVAFPGIVQCCQGQYVFCAHKTIDIRYARIRLLE